MDTDFLWGNETFELLDFEARRRFDADWQAALASTERDFDLEPLMLLVCRWWTAGGGNPAVADATCAEYRRLSGRFKVGGDFTSGEPVCACTAAEILDVLGADDRVEFVTGFGRELAEAAVTRSWEGMWQVVWHWYIQTQTTSADRAAIAAEIAEARRMAEVPGA